jgi:GAF domain-containing protein
MRETTTPSNAPQAVQTYQYTIRYAIIGAAFGLLFPIVATIIVALGSAGSLSMASLSEAQSASRLLWIIDTAPLFLGLFAAFAGQREDQLQLANRQLEAAVASLKGQVVDKAREIDRAVEVSHSITHVADLGQMLAEASELIRASFDLYYAQVYLLDEDDRFLILRAGTGEVGPALVRQRWRLPVGPGSIVGAAAREKRTILVADTKGSQIFQANPLLPETAAEVAMPLLVGQRVVGILDLQSSELDQLTSDNLPALEAVAGQLAVAVEHARLVVEATEARSQVEAQTRLMVGRGWQEFLNAVDRGEVLGYTYDNQRVSPLQEPLPERTDGHDLQVPIVVAGQTLGAVRVSGEGHHPWSRNDSELVAAVAAQVARQVENLRLLAEADQYRADAEAATRRLIREGWQGYRQERAGAVSGYQYDRYKVTPWSAQADSDGEGGGPGSRLARPLLIRGQTIGQLEVIEPSGSNEAAGELLAAVADQLSTHLESLRLTEQRELALAETEEQARRLAALNHLSEALANAQTPDEVYRIAASQLGNIVPAERLSLAIRRDDQGRFEILALDPETGATNIGFLDSIEGTVVGVAFRENRVVNVSGARYGRVPGIESFLVAPLTTGGQILGTLNAGSNRRHAFVVRDKQLLSQAASLIAATLESRRLFAETQQRAEELAVISQMAQLRADELAVLNEMGQALTSLADQQTVINIAYDHASRLMRTEGFYAALYDKESDRVTIRILGEGEEVDMASLEPVGGRGMTEYIIKTGKPLLIRENAQAQLEELGIELNGRMPASWLGVPMISGSEVLGVLAVQSFEEPNAYDEHHRDLLTAVASQVAIAIENARLFDQVQARAKREQILREITAQVRGKADVDTIMRTAAEEVGRALGRQSFVYLRDSDEQSKQDEEAEQLEDS